MAGAFSPVADPDPCCDNEDPCDPDCGDPCAPGCVNCDDNNPCTADSCSGGACFHDPDPDPCCPCNAQGGQCCSSSARVDGGGALGEVGCCLETETCCGGTECCDPAFCCGNGQCCAPLPCEGCLENGTLSGGTISVEPPVVCLGDAITFTLEGVENDGGIKRVDCTAKEAIDPVAPTYEWELTVPPNYPPPLPPLTGTGPVVTVTAQVAGTFSVTFTASADRECPPNSIEIGPETGFAIEVRLLGLKFDSDHGLLLDNNTNYEPDGQLFAEPEWMTTVSPTRNNPISHTMDQNVTVSLIVNVAPVDSPALPFSITGTSGEAGFHYDGAATFSGGANFVTMTSLDRIERKIQKITPTIQWSFVHEERACGQALSGPHTVYVTMGTPRDASQPQHRVTQKRMEGAIVQAGAATSLDPHEIVETVIWAAGEFDLTTTPANAWLVPDTGGDCQSIIRFGEKVAKMIDIPGVFSHRNIYAVDSDPTVAIENDPAVPLACCGLNTDPRALHPNGIWILALVDGSGGCNAFEAAAKFTACNETRYYPGGVPNLVFNNKDYVLNVFERLSWIGGTPCVEVETVYSYPPPGFSPLPPPCP